MNSNKEEVKATFEKWLETQDEGVKTLIAERFQALENTVAAVREERNGYSKELKAVGLKLEKGSEAETLIADLNNRLSVSEQKSNFLSRAITEGCTRPSAAYSIAKSENLITDGEVDWKKVRETVPELFKVKDTQTNAGSGTQKPSSGVSANDILRGLAHK